MADPDAEGEDGLEEINPEYYSILNVRKDASEDEIKAAYHRMCVIYHPDKHRDPKSKQIAVSIFNKLHKAYDVLSNRQKRLIYDLYGIKGLDAGWEIVERVRTPKEIREEYDRLQHEADKRRIEQHTNPQGATTVTIDARDLFSPVDDDEDIDPFYQDERSMLSNIEIQQMSISQSIEAPLTRDNTAILSGSLENKNGNGTGRVSCTLRRVFSPKSFGEFEFGGGDGAMVRVKGYRNLGKKTSGTVSINSAIHQARLTAGLNAMISRQLSNHTMGYLTWNGGMMSSMTSLLVRSTERYHATAQLQLTPRNPSASVSYTHKFNDDTKAKLRLKFGFLGLHLLYGCEHKMTSLSRIGAYVSIGQASGVSLEVRVHRHTQSFNFPVLLSEVFLPSAVFYATITPVIVYYSVKALFIAPLLKQQHEKDMRDNQEKFAAHIAQKRQEAADATNLMLNIYERVVNQEQTRHGLIIMSAWYGKFDPNCVLDLSSGLITNVKIPVQCLVRDSKLIITDSTKSQLNGFYDPCPSQEKYLKIVYEFRDAVHEAVFTDDERVYMPKQSHLISSKVS